MDNTFRYRDIDSGDFGIFIAGPPAVPVPVREVERVAVPGRDGTLLLDMGRFEDVIVSYELSFKLKRHEVEDYAHGIKTWLVGKTGIFRLSDSYDWDYFWMASFSPANEISNIFNRAGRVMVEFISSPRKYSYIGQELEALLSAGGIYNLEAENSKPYIKVYGSGNGNLYINNQTIQLRNINGYVELDSEIEQAYKGTTSKNSDVTLGEFPVFVPGKNNIQWDGGITKIDYIPRWCTL